MPPVIETGHAKNVANFEDFISFITGYGAIYNPTKGAIKLPALTALHTTAKADILNVTTKTVAFNNVTNARVDLFEPLRKLGTRLVNAFSASDATSEMIKDAKGINRKLQGKRAKAIEVPVDPNTPAPDNISASQQSYDQLIEHFTKLIELLKTPDANYAPNETDLKIATLTAQLAALQAANTNVSTAYTAVSNARLARNKTLYNDKTGLYDITLDVKIYVKSLFGATAPEYKQISKIKFNKPKTF
jgi:prefoldin subunit 5